MNSSVCSLPITFNAWKKTKEYCYNRLCFNKHTKTSSYGLINAQANPFKNDVISICPWKLGNPAAVYDCVSIKLYGTVVNISIELLEKKF